MFEKVLNQLKAARQAVANVDNEEMPVFLQNELGNIYMALDELCDKVKAYN